MQLTLYQIDAFTDRVFGGNPAAIVPLAQWLSAELMQCIALENNLSETAFFVKTPRGYHIRWFTPTHEVDLCGHATLATAAVLYEHLGESAESIHFDARRGPLKVSRVGEAYQLDFPVDTIKAVPDPNGVIAKAIGVTPEACYQGADDYLVILGDEAQVRSLEPDLSLVATLTARGLLVSAPGHELDFVSRCFFPQFGIDEDPVTGSAHTTMAPYWSDRLGKEILEAAQISARGGRITCEMRGDRVLLRGQCVSYMIGTIYV